MPAIYIIDENGNTLRQVSLDGSLAMLPIELLNATIEFLPPRALFNMRRVSFSYLQALEEKLEECLLSACISNNLVPIQQTIPQHPWNVTWQVPQWITMTAAQPVMMPPMLMPFSRIQNLAFNSPYAMQNYTIAQRITLAWSYDSANIDGVLSIIQNQNAMGMGMPGQQHQQLVARSNISHFMDSNNYYPNDGMYMPAPAAGMVSITTNVMEQLAALGVTQAEFTKIPLEIRKFLMLDQIIINRNEIDCIIANENKLHFMSRGLISGINKIINMLPFVQEPGAMMPPMHNQPGTKLFKIQVSDFCLLYKQTSGKVAYVADWLESYLKDLRIYQEPLPLVINSVAMNNAPVIGRMFVNANIYSQVRENLDAVMQILKSTHLTAEDLTVSRGNGFDLQMLQDKINRCEEETRLKSSSSLSTANPKILRFTTPSLSNGIIDPSIVATSSCSSSTPSASCSPRWWRDL